MSDDVVKALLAAAAFLTICCAIGALVAGCP